MTRYPTRFTQADVQRALRAVTGLGLKIAEVKISPDGTINVFPVVEGQPMGDDAILAQFRAKQGHDKTRP